MNDPITAVRSLKLGQLVVMWSYFLNIEVDQQSTASLKVALNLWYFLAQVTLDGELFHLAVLGL